MLACWHARAEPIQAPAAKVARASQAHWRCVRPGDETLCAEVNATELAHLVKGMPKPADRTNQMASAGRYFPYPDVP